MKATIITIFDLTANYGNRLQNYAVQNVLENMGFETESVSFLPDPLNFKCKVKHTLHKLTGYRMPGKKVFWKYGIPRQLVFRDFNKNYIKSVRMTNKKEIENIETDFFVVGSDQVWNPAWYNESPLKKDLFLLTFAKDFQKVSFSASFGVESLPDEWNGFFKNYLSRFNYISVREKAGANIVKNLTGREAEVLIDPTMMLTSDEWMKISKPPKNTDCSRPYILTYFLGGCSDERKKQIQKIADENSLKIYSLLDGDQPDIYLSGPSEFIYLISNAKLVVTDSFHACVFSFLFNKPFLVFNREGKRQDMMSRIENLLDILSLQRKYVNSGCENEIFECDYSEGFRRLEEERLKVKKFLKAALNADNLK